MIHSQNHQNTHNGSHDTLSHDCGHAPHHHHDVGAVYQQPLAGARSTRQRSAIREVLADEGRPMTPPEILEIAKLRVPKLGIATVYRNIKAMADIGEICAVPLPGDRIYYELAHRAQEHHHHFRCNRCDRVFDVAGCSDGFASLAPKGFRVQSHDLTLYGICTDCNKNSK